MILFDLIFYTHTPTKKEAKKKKKMKTTNWEEITLHKAEEDGKKKVKMQSKKVKEKCIIVKTKIDIYT